jgi:hypothetical protein
MINSHFIFSELPPAPFGIEAPAPQRGGAELGCYPENARGGQPRPDGRGRGHPQSVEVASPRYLGGAGAAGCRGWESMQTGPAGYLSLI